MKKQTALTTVFRASRLLLLPALLLFLCAAPAQATTTATAAEQPRANVLTATEQTLTALKEFCLAGQDHYAAYYTPEEYADQLEDYMGTFGGIGVSMVEQEENVCIYSVIKGSPAEQAGLQAGDLILAADGESLIGKTLDEASMLVRGEIGTTVVLTIRHADGSEEDIPIIRDEIVNETVTGYKVEQAENTVCIEIDSFNQMTPSEFVRIYNELREQTPIDNLIIDLRSNGGGSLYAGIELAGLFVPTGHIVMKEKTINGMEEYPSPSGMLNGIDLYIWQNEWTASASELMTGALRDEADAVVLGTVSFGKGITQSVDVLDSGAAICYTRSRYYTPSGYDLHGIGLSPDYKISIDPEMTSEAYFSHDPAQNPYLQKTLDIINH